MMSNEHQSEEDDDERYTPPLAWHHLTGGVALLLGANRRAMIIAPESLRAFKLRPRHSVLALFKSYQSIRVLGRTVYQDAEDMKDLVSDNFVLSARTAGNTCLAHNQERYWSGVSNVSHEEERSSEGVLASRMTSQIRICLRRLERLSLAYRAALSIVGSPRDRKAKTITNDKYAQHIGAEFRSALNELYGLRDALIAAAYRLKYGQLDGFQMKSFRRVTTRDQGAFGRLIAQSMFDEGADLLIDRMSLYRGVSLHCLGRTNPIFGDGYQKRVDDGPLGEIPYLLFPLYDDVEHMREIEKGSSKGILRPVTRAEAERFLSKDAHIDALEFSFDCFVRLLQLAQLLATETGLASRPMVITDADIIEATVTDGAGKQMRVKRDPTTGKLVEY